MRVVSRLNIGGPTIHVKNLTEGLDRQSFETLLIVGTISKGEGDMQYIAKHVANQTVIIRAMQREIHPIMDFIAFIKILKLIGQFKPDVVHSHTSKAGALSRTGVFLCNIFQRKKIIAVHTFHGNVLDGYFSRLKSFIFLTIERLLAKFTDRIVAISDSQRWELLNIYKIGKPSNIDVINLGFDLEPFVNCSTYDGFLRKKLNLSDDALLIGIVGRMVPIKNHKMFLDAGKLLIEYYPRKDIRLVLIGDGEDRENLEQYTREIGLSDRVIFHGWEKNIPMVYADLDILALTSLNEGTPVSVIEALAASVPVVTTGVGGIKDLLGKIENKQPCEDAFKICKRGILCPKGDAIKFAEALRFMIESDYLRDSGRFSAASEFITQKYSNERLIHDIESLYDELMPEKQCSSNHPPKHANNSATAC